MSKPFPPAVAAPEKKKKFEQYEIESATSDILRAEEHKQNPELMKHVVKHAAKKHKAMKSIVELRQTKTKLDAQANKAKGAQYDEEDLE